MKDQDWIAPYAAPAGGWGSVQSLAKSLVREHIPISGSRVLMRQNKTEGFACVCCAWAKPAHPHPFEFCENGAKATTWELDKHARHAGVFRGTSGTELETWSDHRARSVGPPYPSTAVSPGEPTSTCHRVG